MAPGSPATLFPWSIWFCVVVGGAHPAEPLTVARGRGSAGAGAVSPAPILAPLATKLVETRWSGWPWTPSLLLSPPRGFLLF